MVSTVLLLFGRIDVSAIDPNLYAQRIAGDGSPQWTPDGIVISSATDYQAFPVVISDGAGGAIIAWRDGRNTASFWDIYVQQVNTDGNLGVVTGIAIEPNIVMDFALSQNYPNPFNPSTTIYYSIPTSESVTLKVYDVLGNEVATLVNEEKPVGTYEIIWQAANLPSGIYFYTINAGSFIETKKMILLK